MNKLSKKQRRVVRKMMFPVVALIMMTATIALAGTGPAPTPASSSR
ncbi:MAG: hypothetical protein SFX73_36915 [Kofleriaceae bacterium]|nr:hypothetical protein [Kofleriaceae bacterium]